MGCPWQGWPGRRLRTFISSVVFFQSGEGELAPLAGLKHVPGKAGPLLPRLGCSRELMGRWCFLATLALPAMLLAWDLRPFHVLHRRNSLERAAPLRDGKQVAAPAGPAASSMTLPLRSKNAFSDGRVRVAAVAGSALS